MGLSHPVLSGALLLDFPFWVEESFGHQVLPEW